MMNTPQESVFPNLLTHDLGEIIATANAETWPILNQLLSYKCKIIAANEAQRQDFPVDKLYRRACSLGIPDEIVKNALVMQRTEAQFLRLIRMIENCCGSVTCDSLEEFCFLLKVAVDVSDLREQYLEIFLKQVKLERVENSIIECLYKSAKKTKDCVVKQMLPRYLKLIPISEHFVCSLHNYAIETKDFLFLCIVSNQLYKLKQVINYLFLKSEQFWFLLEEGITEKDGCNLKLAGYVLSKTIDYIYNNYSDISNSAFHISASNTITMEMRDTWLTYFLLLDMSQEKQLHLIEPCLLWLDQLKPLPILWQNSIYKLYLKHHQNTAVYNVSERIFSHPYYNEAIIPYVFEAINKNDCTNALKNVFFMLKHFTAKLENKQFEDMLKKWLVIQWNPVATWNFCNNVFTIETKFKISTNLFLSVLRKIGHLPDKYLRRNCMKIVLKYFRHNLEPPLAEMLSISQYLYYADHKEFAAYVKFYEANFHKYDDQILNIVKSWASPNMCFIDETVITALTILANLNLESVIVYIKENIGSFNVTLKEDIYIHLFDYFSIPEVLKHIESQIIINKNNLDKFTCLLAKVAYKLGNTNILKLGVSAIENPDLISKILSQSLANLCENPEVCNKFFKLWINKCQNNLDKLNGHPCATFIELLTDSHLKEGHALTPSNIEELINTLLGFLESKDDIVVKKIFQMLRTIFSFREVNRVVVFEFMYKCLDVLLVSNGLVFNELAPIFVTSVYDTRFMTDLNYQNEVLKITETLLSSLKENDHFLHMLAKQLKILCTQCPENIKLFKPICIELFLHGMVTNKTGRTEYYVYQEIATYFEENKECPNFIKTKIRLLALECLLGVLACKSAQAADQCATLLIKKYKQFYKKRYFPDSQVLNQPWHTDESIMSSKQYCLCLLTDLSINFHQMRILQLLLIIQPLLDTSRKEVIDLIMNSFREEIHQPCVKQLMEWLLIVSLKDRPQEALKMITETMDMVNRSQPSCVMAFIPIIYHLALLTEEEHWGQVFDLLLTWSMGPNFKLRVYSQKAITALYEKAIARDYQKLLFKYNFLYMAMIKVMDCSLDQFNATLKQDYDFFNTFDPCRDYCLEAILVDLPRMNVVSPSEWENVARYTFTTTSVPVVNKCRLLSDRISRNYIKPTMPEESKSHEATTNVQKKITPWKTFLDQDEEEKDSRESNEFILVASLIEKANNLGGLTRTCEVFGIKKVVVDKGEVTNTGDFKSLSMSSENWTEFVEVKVAELKTFLERLKSEGYTVVGAEQTAQSVKLGEYRFPKKSALVLGNEKEGIPPEIIATLDCCIEIPQFGVTRSLNVHVAGALFMWEYAKQTST